MNRDKSMASRIEEKATKIATPVAEELGLDIVDVEYLQDGGYWYLRVYIEKSEGDVDLEDCAKLSNGIEEKVDTLVEEKFFLEVSSPGLERPLKKEKDFIRFTGEKVRLILKHKLEDSRNWTGVITKYENETIFLDADREILEIPYTEVKKANLVFEFEDF